MDVVHSATEFLYVVPSVFLLAVLCKCLKEWIDARRQKKPYAVGTEPVVLMSLGCIFLIFNARFVRIVANVAEQSMKATPNLSTSFVGTAYGVAAVVLIASFAKAFWTHINLEEGHWGPTQNYRQGFENKPRFALFEFGLRVFIALFVVVLQEQIAQVGRIDRIEQASAWRFDSDAAVATFLARYDDWLAQTAFCGIIVFTLILIWLGFVVFHNLKNTGVWWAFVGTLTFAVPGLILSWSLNYLATGSALPSLTTYGQPEATQVIAATDVLIFLAGIIGANLIYTLVLSSGAFRDLYRTYKGTPPKAEVPV